MRPSSPSNSPLDPRVRLAIALWPDDAPRGAVSVFCAEQGISRKTFYLLRRRAREQGPDAAIEPRSRRPKNSPSKTADETIEMALEVRRLLEESGLDYGPISVSDKMAALEMPAPSPATLARAFRKAGVARAQPQKKPRSSWKRFVYPRPNDCWQIDATAWVLSAGRTCVIFQLIDDHSRFQLASLAAESENAASAVEVVTTAVTRHGIPRRFLSDNGTALNPTRFGRSSQLVNYLLSLGVQPITGKPYKPTTQGKNERFHRTLTQWLSKQPLVDTLSQLQTQLDEFEIIYNTQRPHQGLPERVTPFQAWNAQPKAPPPQLPAEDTVSIDPGPRPSQWQHRTWTPGVDDYGLRLVSSIGVIQIHTVNFHLGLALAGVTVAAVWDNNTVMIATPDGELLITYPAPGSDHAPKDTRYFSKKHALEITPALQKLLRKS